MGGTVNVTDVLRAAGLDQQSRIDLTTPASGRIATLVCPTRHAPASCFCGCQRERFGNQA
jgi:hypothetical protein